MEKELLNLILSEIREMKGDVSELKSDMKEVKTRLTNLENRMDSLENRMTNVENDMSEVKIRLTNLENRMDNLENRMSNVEDLGEFNKETSEAIRNVVTSHYMEFKKYIKSNNVQHNLYNAKLLEYKKEN